MFTGIIEEVGTVREAHEGELAIACKKVLWGTNLGDSIAVNGVDLTAKHFDEHGFEANVMGETYRRSNLGELKAGDPVNLERSLQLAGRVSGHLVRGVVEATATLDSFTPEGEAIIARFAAPPDVLRHILIKGPVAIDGISLTVTDKDARSFAVSLVQYTQDNTNLRARKPGDRINIETDIIARYVELMLEDRRDGGAE
ncbi:MAG TPA: riboflavin synthase [Dehalococcoidia bacterium]|jgi:riboflavin synthase|nr:riboflavin synthase [Dehalococcoidia bacterium]